MQPEVEGFITHVCVKSGQRVRPGTPLVQINQQRQEASVLSVEANRAGTEADVAFWRQQVKRLEALEGLAAKRNGVEKVYALQAGREIRVIVKPGEVDDDQAALLSHEIAREIEHELAYPGQIKVTVIRQSRSTEFAK